MNEEAKVISLQTGRATPTRGVPVELDRTRYLRFSLATMQRLREEFGEGELTPTVADEKLAKILWYGLRGSDPDLTLEAVKEMVDMEHINETTAAMRKALGQREEDGAVAPSPPPPPALPSALPNP